MEELGRRREAQGELDITGGLGMARGIVVDRDDAACLPLRKFSPLNVKKMQNIVDVRGMITCTARS